MTQEQDEIDARIADAMISARQQAIQQNKDATLAALDLLSKGTPVETIAKETKLSEDYVRQLQSKVAEYKGVKRC
jgi:DNA-binding NarL/FixJ family response regulator